MLKIRLRRTGKRNQPHYRLVVAEHTAPVTGKIVDQLGHFNPRTKELVIKKDEAMRWLQQGAQPSNTVARLLLAQGLEHKALVVHTFPERPSKKAPKPDAEPKPATVPSAESTADETDKEVAAEPAEAAEPSKEAENPKEEVTETPQEGPSEETEKSE